MGREEEELVGYNCREARKEKEEVIMEEETLVKEQRLVGWEH